MPEITSTYRDTRDINVLDEIDSVLHASFQDYGRGGIIVLQDFASGDVFEL